MTAIAVKALPASLHVPGATNVVPDRLPRGFNSGPCLAAMGLDPARRRRVDWHKREWWHHSHNFKQVA